MLLKCCTQYASKHGKLSSDHRTERGQFLFQPQIREMSKNVQTSTSLHSFQFSSVAQSCLTLWDPMNCSMPGLPVFPHFPEFAQTHVHWLGNAIQPSFPLLSLFPPAFDLSQHLGLFQWVSNSHCVAKVLEIELQHQSFQWIFRVDFIQKWLVWSPCCPRDLKSLLQHHNSKASIFQCSVFFMVQVSHLYMTSGKTIALTIWTLLAKWYLCFLIHCLGCHSFEYSVSVAHISLYM